MIKETSSGFGTTLWKMPFWADEVDNILIFIYTKVFVLSFGYNLHWRSN